jgi:hypothetical protein
MWAIAMSSMTEEETTMSHDTIKRAPLAFRLAAVMVCLLGSLCYASCQSIEQPTGDLMPTPTPHYLPPLSGRVFVTTLGTQLRAIGVWNKPGGGVYGSHEVFTLSHGTPVEIIQSVWIVLQGQPGCYYYLVRTDHGSTGWIGGQSLTQDLSQISTETCIGLPRILTPTPQSIGPILVGPAYLTTFGTQKETVDLWSTSALDQGDSQILFSKPHGTQVTPVKYIRFVGTNGQLCHTYYVRTEDGQEGWVAGSSLTQDLSQPPLEANCAQVAP